MGRKIVELFGVVRTVVIVIVLIAMAAALSTLGAHLIVIGAVLGLFAFLFWKAPFGAKYRKNF